MMLRSLYHVQNRHMIQFAVRQSCRHVDSLALIISWITFLRHSPCNHVKNML